MFGNVEQHWGYEVLFHSPKMKLLGRILYSVLNYMYLFIVQMNNF